MKEQKIVVEVHGRLGNQLFQYAFARAVQKETGAKIFMNFHYLGVQARRQPTEQGWEDSLKGFQTVYETVPSATVKWTATQRFLIFLGRVLMTRASWRKKSFKLYEELTGFAKLFANLSRKHSLYQFPNHGLPYKTGREKTIFLKAFFEDEKLVNPVREQLLEEFQPRKPLLVQNQELMRVIESTNSVCLTIRRGDFVGMKQLFLCDEAYFKRGIAAIKARVKAPVFIFFSDDLAYARNFATEALGDEVFYVETAGNPLWEKLRLMRACKHFILSNSTFSWWAQYLGEAPDKIVVGPAAWMPGAPKGQAPVMESWVKI